MCDTLRVLVLEARSLALIDLRKKDICAYCPKSEDLFEGMELSHPIQSRKRLAKFLDRTTGNKCCALIR